VEVKLNTAITHSSRASTAATLIQTMSNTTEPRALRDVA